MSGKQAARQLLKMAEREEFLAADLVARALTCSKRKLLRDWRSKARPETKVGREVMLASRLVVEIYFPHEKSNTN